MSDERTIGYHVFYVNGIGMRPEYRFFWYSDEAELLLLVEKAQNEESSIHNLVVIAGEKLRFEPYEKVVAWRIADGKGDAGAGR